MADVDKLLKYLNSPNIADMLDEEDVKDIAEDVQVGYEIDEESRHHWLEVNEKAVKMIKTADKDSEDEGDKDFPFHKASKVVYPLIAPAVIQLASRLIQHLVRNNKVAECVVLGQDQDGQKEAKAKRVSDFLSYEMLIESDSWLTDEHKLLHVLAAWGVAFKEVYYDNTRKEVCSEFIPPKDVIINHNTISLSKCRRITLRYYMTKNDIIEQVRAGYFCDVDLDDDDNMIMDNQDMVNDSREECPVYEVLKQFCYLDLDDDEYEEPYFVWMINHKKKILNISPAFEVSGLDIDEKKGTIKSIKPKDFLVDHHLINDPEGKFYSLGLNHMLFHQNKAITSVLRQLIDAGILSNTAATSGFVTKAFKIKERSIRLKLGEFKVLDTMPGVDIRTQMSSLPFKEPSQVLLALLQFLVESGKEMGFMTDVLTGDAQTQNVPATTMLAMVEQGTRAFKPVVQKLYNSLKKEFKIWFHLHSQNMDEQKYFNFQDTPGVVGKQDFDESSVDIVPVADPTMSSEAHKYARIQAWLQLMQTPMAQACNVQEGLMRFFSQLEYPQPEKMIAPPQPKQPDPKMLELQLKQQIAQAEQQNQQLQAQLQHMKLQLDAKKLSQKDQEIDIKQKESQAKTQKIIVDAHKESLDAVNQEKMTQIEGYNAETERQRVAVLEKSERNKANSKSNSNGNS